MDAFSLFGWLVLATTAGDMATTHIGLSSGGREINPIMRHELARYTLPPATAAVLLVTTERLRKSRPKTALAMRIAVVAVRGYVIAHNVRQIGGM